MTLQQTDSGCLPLCSFILQHCSSRSCQTRKHTQLPLYDNKELVLSEIILQPTEKCPPTPPLSRTKAGEDQERASRLERRDGANKPGLWATFHPAVGQPGTGQYTPARPPASLLTVITGITAPVCHTLHAHCVGTLMMYQAM